MKTYPLERVRVWDAPTRICHWGMVACFGVSWWTADTHNTQWHVRSGYVLLGLLLFRIYWGFFGSSTARFMGFLRGPHEVAAHVRHLLDRTPVESMGHNALGALSVLAMLLLLVAQVVLGLFTVDVDGIESGPLSHLVDFETGRLAAHYHGVSFTILQWLIGLHIAALLFYTLWKRDSLLVAMITGNKQRQSAWRDGELPRFASLGSFLLGVALAGAGVWYIVN